MFGFSKKKEGAAQPVGGPRIPTERVVSLSSQGLSEPEIIRSLRDEGYSPLEVDRAMKQALRTGAGTGMQAPPGPQPMMPPQRMEPPAPQYGYQPQRGPPFGEQQQGGPTFPKFPEDKFAPTMWESDEEDMEDDLDKAVPKEKALGPDQFLSRMDEDLPPIPDKDEEPLPYTEPPLPKDRGDRTRELKDRRRREIEELTEEITDEKSQDMMNRLQSLEDKVDKMASGLKSGIGEGAVSGAGVPMQEIEDVKRDLEDQKHSLEDTNARIDSLEEVVKGSLAPVIESVRKFSHAIKTTKPPQGPSGPPAYGPKA